MELVVCGHPYFYEMQNVAMMFFPGQPMEGPKEAIPPMGDYFFTGLEEGAEQVALSVRCRVGEEERQAEGAVPAATPGPQRELALARLAFDLLVPLTGIRPPWGILTGIRPVKLLRSLVTQGMTTQEAEAAFTKTYYVSQGRIQLARETQRHEDPILASSRPESYSLYISLPFCPTRCSYCSFVSHAIDKARRLMPDYLRLLGQELELTAGLASGLGLRLETVYIGGGTPTTLEADQLAAIMAQVRASFDLSHLREYTVEAGRPDTITREKLEAIRAGGADRVSVNPQSFSPQVLRAVERPHTVEQFYQAYELARELGFVINVDLIAGLPQETLASFRQGVDKALALAPGNLTLHTLAIKRAADMAGHAQRLRRGEDSATAMVDYAYSVLAQAGYLPYYLYRQRNIAENLENVGFARPGQEGLYNAFIMDETHTVAAVGAGGVTKLRQPGGTYIERIFNYKYPYEYISRFEEICRRKEQMTAFYHKYGNFSNHH